MYGLPPHHHESLAETEVEQGRAHRSSVEGTYSRRLSQCADVARPHRIRNVSLTSTVSREVRVDILARGQT
jgi:hypothetical protein